VLTHFGIAEDPATQLRRCHDALHEEADLVARTEEPEFIAQMEERVAREAPEVAEELAQAVPYHHIWKGLTRWHSKRGG
jgi:hypothetical protein